MALKVALLLFPPDMEGRKEAVRFRFAHGIAGGGGRRRKGDRISMAISVCAKHSGKGYILPSMGLSTSNVHGEALQALSVTVTVLGTAKSVTVSDWHSIWDQKTGTVADRVCNRLWYQYGFFF